ncbi:MAG: DUF2393 domain-containing protein [Acidobacteriia bacterium]|nr:DUF2393 domain-containing protein [Terriglobia bacterium]
MIPSVERSRLPVAFLAGLVIVALLIGGAVLFSRFSSPAGSETVKPLPMRPSEQGYAPQIHFLEPKMSRAANFLNQEVTFIFGTIENGGNRRIRQIEITLEFHDPFNQVVLRDTQRLFPPNAAPLAPGERRDFQIGYESIPAQWNNVYPSIRVTGLGLD